MTAHATCMSARDRAVARHGHLLADGAPAALRQAAEEPWIAGCPRCRAHLVTAAAAEGFTPDIHHSTDDYVVTQRLVAAGLRVALLPSLALEAARDPRVHPVPLQQTRSRRISLDRSSRLPSSPATAALADAVLHTTAPRQ